MYRVYLARKDARTGKEVRHYSVLPNSLTTSREAATIFSKEGAEREVEVLAALNPPWRNGRLFIEKDGRTIFQLNPMFLEESP